MSVHPHLRAVSADRSIAAEFVPDAGMVCCSLRHRGEGSLDPRKGLEAYATRGSTMGMPLLYPWANRLGAYTYEVAGKRVTLPADRTRIHQDEHGLPIHGVAPALMRWTPLGGGTDADSVVRARLEWSSPDLLQLFPFAHEVLFEASAEPDALRIVTTVRANAGQPVPVAFGYHPYLRLSPADRTVWSIDLPRARRLMLDERQLPTGQRRPATTDPVTLAGQDLDDAYELETSPDRFVATGPERRIEIELLEGFGYGQVYSPSGSPFVCFEPMTAPADALRTGDGLRVLAPGEEHRAGFRLAFASNGRPGPGSRVDS